MPSIGGKRGNPVVWSRRFFPELMAVEGDIGARHLIGRCSEAVVEVPLSGTAALTDVDTPEALAAVKAGWSGPEAAFQRPAACRGATRLFRHSPFALAVL